MYNFAKSRFDDLIEQCRSITEMLHELHGTLSSETHPLNRRRYEADIKRLSGFLVEYIAEAETLVAGLDDSDRATLAETKAAQERLNALSSGEILLVPVSRETAQTLLEVLSATEDPAQGIKDFVESLALRLNT
jgi:hypothetical protein